MTSTSGGIISNAERNTTQREVAFRTSWALNGRTDVFAEVAVNDRELPRGRRTTASCAPRPASATASASTFGPQNNTLRGEVSAGWGWQAPRDGRLGEIEGFIVDANLAWRASALTTFLLTARSDFVDTTTTGSFGALSRQVGLEARHTFRRYLIGIAGIRYTVNPYDAVSINERDLTTELGLRLLPQPRRHHLRPLPAHRLPVHRGRQQLRRRHRPRRPARAPVTPGDPSP